MMPPRPLDTCPIASVPLLITGVGYIGAALALHFLERGERVIGLENFFSTPAKALRKLYTYPEFSLVRGSVASKTTLARALGRTGVDTVVHLAAQASAHPDAGSAIYTERTNLIGSRMLLDAATAHGVQRVVFGSSFHVYGSPLLGTIDERASYGAFSDLSHLSKMYVEKLLEMYAGTFPGGTAAIRLGIVYGLGPVMKRDARFMTVPNRFACQAAGGEPLRVNAGARWPLGFIHLDDAERALTAAVRRAPAEYFCANAVGEVRTVKEVANLIARHCALKGLPVSILEETGATAAVNESGSPTSFKVKSRLTELGWRPTERMEQRLPEVIDYFLRDPE